MSRPILVTSKLCRRFGGLKAITDLNLEIASDCIHSIIGPNGAGKTTTFNLITQNLKPSSGQVIFEGEYMHGLTPDRVARAGISRTYQNIRLFGTMSAIENLLVGMHLHLRSPWRGSVVKTGGTRRDGRGFCCWTSRPQE